MRLRKTGRRPDRRQSAGLEAVAPLRNRAATRRNAEAGRNFMRTRIMLAAALASALTAAGCATDTAPPVVGAPRMLDRTPTYSGPVVQREHVRRSPALDRSALIG